MAVKKVAANDSPAARLQAYIARFEAKEQAFIRSIRSAVRKRLPTANELLYDYKTFFVIAYSATEHPSDGVLSIAARPDGVRLYLMHAPKLHDPKKLLKGTGKQTRYVQLENARHLAHADIEALIAGAIDHNVVPLPLTGAGKLIIRT